MDRPLPGLSALSDPLAQEVLRLWETFAADVGVGTSLSQGVLESLAKVWACSPFSAKYCVVHSTAFLELVNSGHLETPYSEGHIERHLHTLLDTNLNETGLMQVLRQFRQREMVRIAWRDIAGMAGLPETLRDISDLARAILQHTLNWLHDDMVENLGTPCDDQGTPLSLVIIAMGKLGAGELNFSSDIDLMFIYPSHGPGNGSGNGQHNVLGNDKTQGGRRTLSNGEFFSRLGKRLIKVLNDTTEDGLVFRVDMRLRPFGDSGALVWSSGAMEDYYQIHGRDWERYALIKASIVAGDATVGQQLLTQLSPFIYRRYLDFGTLQAIRSMKQMINNQSLSKGYQNDIKLGNGGIREIEFIAQTFQLIHGGKQPALRQQTLLGTLDTLAELNYLPTETIAELKTAYVFLRNTEHRLQQIHDLQTQTLPKNEVDRLRVALGMGFLDWQSFAHDLDRHRNRVAEHFANLLESSESSTPQKDSDLHTFWQNFHRSKDSLELLRNTGFDDPKACWELLRKFRDSHRIHGLSAEGKERLDRLLPLLLSTAAKLEHSTEALARVISVVEAIARRSTYLALLAENPAALKHLFRLCSASPWITSLLARHPVLLDELLDPNTLYAPPKRSELAQCLDRELSKYTDDDLEGRMNALRETKNALVLRVAAADIAGALPVEEVSDRLSAIAETLLKAALDLAWNDLTTKYGKPHTKNNGAGQKAGFAIIAYGKLGGFELGYGSDLDLVFLHDSHSHQGMTDGANGSKGIANDTFFLRLAQRIIHYLATLTHAGRTYEIDTRLRPSGASGLLVISLEAFEKYLLNEAWTWEKQALIRARAVAGSPSIMTAFSDVRRNILGTARDAEVLCQEVREMRQRMRDELASHEAETFDLKQGPGAIADIEFVVQYMVLRWANEHPTLLTMTDNLRLLETIAALGLLPKKQCTALRDAYFAYRAQTHRLALQEQPALAKEDEHKALRTEVVTVWNSLFDQ